jgi:hypothetical protein
MRQLNWLVGLEGILRADEPLTLVAKSKSEVRRKSTHPRKENGVKQAEKSSTEIMPDVFKREEILTIANEFTMGIKSGKNPLHTLKSILQSNWSEYPFYFALDFRPETKNLIPYAHLDQGEVTRFLQTSKVFYLLPGSININSNVCTYDRNNFRVAIDDELMAQKAYMQLCDVLNLSKSESYRHSFAMRNVSKPPVLQSQAILKDLGWGKFRELLSPEVRIYGVRRMWFELTGTDKFDTLDASLSKDDALIKATLAKPQDLNKRGSYRDYVISPKYGSMVRGRSKDIIGNVELTKTDIDALLKYAQQDLQLKYPLN